MKIDRALRLKVGDTVSCPADRGEIAYRGKVTHVEALVLTNVTPEYIWVEVRHPFGTKAVWPSNRLGG